LSYKRNNNIYNTYYYIKKTEEYYNIILSQPQLHVALGQTQRKCWPSASAGQPKRWVSSRGGADLVDTQGKGRPAQAPGSLYGCTGLANTQGKGKSAPAPRGARVWPRTRAGQPKRQASSRGCTGLTDT
jgi:hypothetical protein